MHRQLTYKNNVIKEKDKLLQNPEVAKFPITDDVNISKFDRYKDIGYKISNHGRNEYNNNRGIWCYYVYIREESLSPEDFKEFWLPTKEYEFNGRKRISYDYNGQKWSDADWHGGVVTWYQKYGFEEVFRSVEIGCDYNHLWDKEFGYYYDLERIERDAKNTIDSLRKMYRFKISCSWSGECDYEENMVLSDGNYYTKSGLESKTNYFKEKNNE